MYVYFTTYLGKRTAQLLAAASRGDADALEAAASVGAELLATYQEAFDTDHSSVEQAGLWISWALRLSQPKLALKAARRTCERWPSSPQAWSARLRLELRLQSARQRTADELFATFKSALTSVSASQGAELWSYALEAVQPGTKEWARLLDMLKLALAPGPRGPVSGGMGAVTGALLRRVFQEQGIEAVRTVCSSLLTVPPAGGDLFKAAVSVEQEHLAAQRTNLSHKEQAVCEARIRKLYEAAVDVYGSEDVELWLQYAQFEREAFKGAGDVYWRATKALPDPDAFIEQYRAFIGI